MRFYTNFLQLKNKVFIRGWDDGNRFNDEIKYKPHLYVGSQDATQYKTLKGNYLQRVDFDDISAAREFVKKYEDISNVNLFGSTQFSYVCMHEQFPGTVQYDSSKITVLYIDIEVKSDGGFPNVALADREVTAITLYYLGNIYTFGLNDFKTTKKNSHYVKCKDETQLLTKFMDAWELIDADVVTGWNVELFDMPYIMKRVENVLGINDVARFSPYKKIHTKTIQFANRDIEVPVPLGLTILDYLQLYKRFSYTPQESYRLDHIANYELGKGKLDYSEYDSLTELYIKNHQKFIEYNIEDVLRVVELEGKLGFIEQVFAIAYDSKVNYQDTLTTVRLWDTIIHNHLYDKGIMVPHVNYDERGFESSIIGGYVKDPQVGLHHYVTSFDLTSLYPMIIQQYNISPETFRGIIPIDGATTEEKIIKVLEYAFDKSETREFINNQNVTVCASGCTFDRDYQGFLPALMAHVFTQRDNYKKEMLNAKKELEKTKNKEKIKEIESRIAKFNNLQMAKKIQLNSAYGALANRFFRWYEPKFAESITMSGQLTTRWIERSMNQFFNKHLKTDNVDYIIACDTDSMYIRLGEIFEKVSVEDDKKIDYIDRLCRDVLTPFIDGEFVKLAKYVNAFEQKMSMKRESIANKGIWTGKKHYILNNYDHEGVRYAHPKLKMMGIEAVRSSTPPACKEAIKEAIRIIMNESHDSLLDFIKKERSLFGSKPFEEIAFPRGVKEVRKYTDKDTIYSKGTPIHSRGALLFNMLLEKTGIQNKYEPIYDGDKIKFCYLRMPNPLCENVIAIKHSLPPAFQLDSYIDYDTQFDKGFMSPIRSITNAIGWDIDSNDSPLTAHFR